MTQLLPLPTIKADPGRVPAVGGHGDLQLHTGGDDYWPVGSKHGFENTTEADNPSPE